jgi:hypothetical protein
MGKPKGKRPLGRPRCRWVNDIKIDLGEIVRGNMYWIGLIVVKDHWRALVNAVMNHRVL